LEVSLETAAKNIEVTAHLHNFIIDVQRPGINSEAQNIASYDDLESMTNKEQQSGFVPAQPNEFPADPLVSVSGASQMRLTIRNWVQ
jgi:hypothetical protein